MNAKEYLEQYRKMNRMINNKLFEINTLREMMNNTSARTDRSPVQTTHKDAMANAVGKIVDLEQEINNDIDNLINKQREITSIIEKIKSPVAYDVIHKFYIQGHTLSKIATDMNYVYQYVSEVKHEAVEEVQLILDQNAS